MTANLTQTAEQLFAAIEAGDGGVLSFRAGLVVTVGSDGLITRIG